MGSTEPTTEPPTTPPDANPELHGPSIPARAAAAVSPTPSSNSNSASVSSRASSDVLEQRRDGSSVGIGYANPSSSTAVVPSSSTPPPPTLPKPPTVPHQIPIPQGIHHRTPYTAPLSPSFPSAPNSPHHPHSNVAFPTAGTRTPTPTSTLHFPRQGTPPVHQLQDGPYPSSHLRGSTNLSTATGNRGSMVLYRFSVGGEGEMNEKGGDEELVPPPSRASMFGSGRHHQRSSMLSTSSFESDSKYPAPATPEAFDGGTLRGTHKTLVPYFYDPTTDELDPLDDEDYLHDPKGDATSKGAASGADASSHSRVFKKVFPWRGLANITSLILLIGGLLALFVFYPVWDHYKYDAQRLAVNGNVRVNGTGQAPILFGMPHLIDTATPEDVKTRTGFDGDDYVLVFSDEFEEDGRTFWPGDDPFWEAADIWYGATNDQEWYTPEQITTRGGNLVITIDADTVTEKGLTEGSTAPFLASENHDMHYRSGMLQSWNKFCFSSGYIEVAISLPGPNSNTKGYWPGAWTMGNLGRPGYTATTDGMWPYTYDSCDVGTFPNQTNRDGVSPTAALHTDAGREKYNFELSWLPGQRLSSCSCPNSDHPGPVVDGVYRGRGAPEIDVLEAEYDKHNPPGQVISQSAQFAPFTHDYNYDNVTADQSVIYNTAKTMYNTYKGSAIQQAVSTLSKVPEDGFQGSGARKVVYGFEYWANPKNRGEGYISWASNGERDSRMGAGAVGPDPEANGGSGVGQRLIPEEPMSIVLNCGLSTNWQDIDLATMMFPAEMLIDYVRVYQKKGHENVGCSPDDYPTATYIQDHLEAYMNPNKTQWTWPKPVNSLYNQGC